MIRAFVDASVLYAAIISKRGAARELLRRHLSAEVRLVVSDYIVEEVKRNLQEKAPEHVSAIELLLDILNFEAVIVSAEQVQAAAQYTELKDAPVVAAAQQAKCEYLLTFDRQHLIDPPEVAKQSELIITTPDDLMQRLREEEED